MKDVNLCDSFSYYSSVKLFRYQGVVRLPFPMK